MVRIPTPPSAPPPPSFPRQGVYNTDYYSGAQVALYIGDTWIDEVTSLSYVFQQDRKPIYDYANPLFKDMSKGPVIIQGEFTINFKEAGYLWLVLDRYRDKMTGRKSLLQPFGPKDSVIRQNIEQLFNGVNGKEITTFQRNRAFQDLADVIQDEAILDAGRQLGGFSSTSRAQGGIGRAENAMEHFENLAWRTSEEDDVSQDRRPDDPALNPFDIYISYGDFAGDDNTNHTIRKLHQVYIVGGAQQVVIDGQPIQEAYSFMAKNMI